MSPNLHAVEDFSRYFHRSPDRLGPDHIRQYQAYLFRERKLQAGTIVCCTAALRFLYVKTLRRPYLPEHIPFPKRPRQLPVVLSPEEVQRLIDGAENLMRRTMVMTLYSTGIRCSELCHLKVSDIDSERMVIHVRKGKGGRDREVLLCPKLLDTLREYWRWMKPKTYLFPGTVNNWRADVPITSKVVWKAVNEAGITTPNSKSPRLPCGCLFLESHGSPAFIRRLPITRKRQNLQRLTSSTSVAVDRILPSWDKCDPSTVKGVTDETYCYACVLSDAVAAGPCALPRPPC
jgi:hypothetical protein